MVLELARLARVAALGAGTRRRVTVPEPQEWFINTLGNAVNLDVDDDQIIDLELMRRGIRKRGVFGLVGSLDKG